MGKIIYLNQSETDDDFEKDQDPPFADESDLAVDDQLLRALYAAALRSVHPKLSGAFFSTLTLSEDTARVVFHNIATESDHPMLRQWALANLQMLDHTDADDVESDGRKPVVARLISMIDTHSP